MLLLHKNLQGIVKPVEKSDRNITIKNKNPLPQKKLPLRK